MELDDAYANGPYIPGAEDYPVRWASAASAFRANLSAQNRARIGLSYGPGSRQVYDLFLPEADPKGLCVFVHGGYWLKFDRTFWSHFATGPLAHGLAVAMPSYDLCPNVTIAQITRQIAQAIMTAATETPGPISLTGHSAGGHLVARMCVPGVLPNAIAGRLTSVVPISPVADLRPLLKTSMNADLRLDLAAAKAESPVLMTPRAIPVTVWVGACERPAFLDQAAALAAAWACGHVVAPDKHHFDVIDALQNADSQMVADLMP